MKFSANQRAFTKKLAEYEAGVERQIGDHIDLIYEALEGADDLAAYHHRHGTPSLLVLTQHSWKIARESARLLGPAIEGKRVVEIGAGVGFLAVEMARRAKSVVAIEVDPAWSWCFTRSLYRHKSPNLTWIFGAAESVADMIRGDIAVCFTHSGEKELRAVAAKMAPTVLFPLQGFDEAMFLSEAAKGLATLGEKP